MAGGPRTARSVAELPVLALAAIVLAVVVKAFVAQAFFIPSASMVPQLRAHDRVVVSKLAYRLHPPRRGDIVVFSAPPGTASGRHASGNLPGRALHAAAESVGLSQAHTELVTRVIGLPGETVEGHDGHVYVEGGLLDEPYLATGTVTESFGPVVVSHGTLWVMGDNRPNSVDSRTFGPIATSSVVGRTIWRVWPPTHLSFL